MEPHELAIAALNDVAESQSATLASSRSKTAGLDMTPLKTNNRGVNNTADTQETAEQSSQSQTEMSQTTTGTRDSQVALSGQQTNYSDNSQSTTDGHDTVSTPPTSASEGFSSQSTNQDGPLSQLSQLSELAAIATRPSLSIPASAGHKRTADGEVKDKSPISPVVRGHSRNVSTVSNVSAASSKIGELSSELRTRLSYAMVKVNNGWQSHSIDEVESLASQGGSPTSSSSTLQGRRNLVTSPRAAMLAVAQGRGSQVTTGGDFDLYSGGQPSRTYESFWRDHSATTYPVHRHVPAVSPPSRSLGPPADIRPTITARRSGTPKFSKPPTIPSHGSNSPYHGPRTPNREYRENAPPIQTPSHKTIQEQDAIETLLFMSSPGNSGNMNHNFPPPRTQTSPQQSPLRAEFNIPPRSSHGRKVAFEQITDSTESSEAAGPTYSRKIQTKAGGSSRTTNKARSEAIDRMLDDMGDESSDDEIIVNHSTPRRIVAGRG